MAEENNVQGVSNPLSELEVNFSYPQGIEINMVDVSSVTDFEIWGAVTSVMSNFTVGILVGWLTANDDAIKLFLLGFVFVFAVFTIGSFIMMILKRKKMKVNKKSIRMNLNKIE